MSISGFGASPAQFGGTLDAADTAPADAGATEASVATAAQQAGRDGATAQVASSQTAGPGQAMDVWQALQKDPQAQLLQENLLSETDPASMEDSPPVRSDDEVLDDLDDVWDDQDALYDELDQLSEGSVTSSVEGLTPAEIEERIGEIQEELDFLYEYEDLLFDELANPDPDADVFDSFWTEWDLWDVKFDVADLEAELADLQGTVFDWSLGDLWSGFAEGVGNVIDVVIGYYDQQGTLAEETASATEDDQLRFGREQARLNADMRGSRAKREDATQSSRARAQRTLSEHTVPAQSPKLEARLRGVRRLAADLQAGPTKQAKNRLRAAQGLVRGKRP